MRGAAETLSLTHTTVSRRLAILEKTRGNLFERKAGGYRTTSLGDTLVEVAERMEALSLAGQRHQSANSLGLAGPLTLSLPEAVAQYMLLEDLFEFSELYPDIDLKVETSYGFANLDRNEADVVVRGVMKPPDHLVGRRLFPNRVTYYADAEYMQNTPKSELSWMAPADDNYWANWIAQSPYPNAPISIVIDDITARHRALVKGLAMGRGACFMADPAPNLIRLSDDEPVAQQDFWILTHPDLKDTPRVRTLLNFIASVMVKKRDLISG